MIPSRANLGVLAGIAFAAFALPISLEAQAVPADTVPRPRVGLALSGGAARGFAHAGVIEVLEGAGVPVDAIAGTSMGSVIGGLYASGFSTSQLRAVTAQVDWDRMFSDEPDRRNLPMERKTEAGRTLVTLPVREGLPRLPSSILTGQRISQLLAGLTWHVHPIDDFRDLPIPFVALATDVETGEAVVLDHGFLADAIRASLAIPSLFAPVQIDGRFLIDGGIARNLPSPDAADLGADIVICSDVTEPLAPADSLVSLLDILNQTISFRMVERRNRDAERCDILIQPDIEGIASADFGRAEAIVERGRAAARAALDSLRALGITGRAEPSGRATRKPVSDRVHVQAVRVSGLRRTPEGTLRGSLELRTPAVLSVRDVNEAVTRVYDTGLFQRVSYRLDPVPAADPSGASPDSAARVLVVDVEDEGQDWVGASYRYEGRYKASILATAALRNLLLNGTTLLADLRLGEQTRVAAEFQRRSGWDLAPLVLLRGEWKRSPFDLYEDGRRVSDPRVRVGLVEAFAGAGVGYAAIVGAAIKFEGTEADPADLVQDWAGGRQEYATLSGIARLDTRDRLTFPRRGVAVLGKTEWAEGTLWGGDEFSHHVLDLDASIPVSRVVSVRVRATAGTADGPDLPPAYLFFVGGSNDFYMYPDRHFSFAGLRVEERRGQHLQAALLGAQWEFLPDLFALGQLNAAALPEEWRIDAEDWFSGFGLGAGLRSRFGSVRLMVTGGEVSGGVRFEIDVGFAF
jgi:NTE family protein